MISYMILRAILPFRWHYGQYSKPTDERRGQFRLYLDLQSTKEKVISHRVVIHTTCVHFREVLWHTAPSRKGDTAFPNITNDFMDLEPSWCQNSKYQFFEPEKITFWVIYSGRYCTIILDSLRIPLVRSFLIFLWQAFYIVFIAFFFYYTVRN